MKRLLTLLSRAAHGVARWFDASAGAMSTDFIDLRFMAEEKRGAPAGEGVKPAARAATAGPGRH